MFDSSGVKSPLHNKGAFCRVVAQSPWTAAGVPGLFDPGVRRGPAEGRASGPPQRPDFGKITSVTGNRYLALGALLLTAVCMGLPQPSRDWPVYGGNPESTRYSPLKQITRANVGRLKVAWTYDASGGGGRGGLQTNPIVVNGVVYGNTRAGKVVALDGASGKLIWSWDSKDSGQKVRGMTWWSDGADRRIFAGFGRYVYALNASTGEAIPSFGKDGRIDLHQDLGRDPEKQSVSLTSPGIVYKDLLIVGGRES